MHDAVNILIVACNPKCSQDPHLGQTGAERRKDADDQREPAQTFVRQVAHHLVAKANIAKARVSLCTPSDALRRNLATQLSKHAVNQ